MKPDFKTDINNQILKDAVKSLLLRFPVADIERATKYGKGDISNFLNDKRPVSDAFLEKFSEAFKIDLRQFGYAKGIQPVEIKKPTPEDEGFSLKAFNEYLIKENEFLRKLLLNK